MQNEKSKKIIMASGICIALVALVWVGLRVLNQHHSSGQFVAETNESEMDASGNPSQVDGEVAGVVSDMEAGLREDSEAMENPKVKVLSEIIEMGVNEDVVAMDEFKNLSPDDKSAMQVFYRQLENEDRNGRGTTVYLLGQNLTSADDLKFFGEVLHEQPCLSLDNCGGADDASIEEVPDREALPVDVASGEGGSDPQVILAYPQIMVLRSLEGALSSASADLKSKMLTLVREAAQNPNPRVQQAATALLQRF